MPKSFFSRRRNSQPSSQQRRKMLLESLENRLAMAIAGLGVAGDSWSDEYAAETYNYARNWAELLRSERGVNLGAPGDYSSDTRGANGTAFNWAEVGATASDMLNQIQDFNIIDQYTAGNVSHAVFMSSNADFAPGSEAFNNVASGTWNKDSFEVSFFIMNFTELMISSMAKENLKTIVTTIPDPTMTPAGSAMSDPVGRQRVRDVIDAYNTRIKAKAAELHLPVVDLAALQTQLLGTAAAPVASRTIGGNVYNVSGGTASSNLFIAGGILPHTVYQAYVANAIIEGLNVAYGENIPRLTEQQISTLAGRTYGGTDTFTVNYSNLVIAPPVTVYLSYGSTGTPNDDFTSRVSEWATARGIAALTPDVGSTPGELSQVKAAILANLQSSFAGTAVNFTAALPADPRFEAIKLGVYSDGVNGPRTSRIGQGTFDWLNAGDQSTGYVFVDLITRNDPGGKPNFDNIDLSTLSRADQLRYLTNVMSFYIANEVGRGMGLQAADAYGYPSITTANAANTGGVQFNDYMSGDPALGFDTSVFNGTPTFTFSPLAKAKLQFGHWLTTPSLATVAEAAAEHGTTATSQLLAFVNSSTPSQLVGVVRGAAISDVGQADLYTVSAAVGDKITAQTFAAGVYGAPIDTVIRILAADGTTVLASSDNTLLGNNSIGQTGTTTASTNSLVLNYTVATAGNIYVEVTSKANGTGAYDLMVAKTVTNNFPWHNASNPLNVTGNTTGTFVTAFDAIAIINELNNPQIMNPITNRLPDPNGTTAPPPYLDVSPSGTLTAFDVIPIINYLNANPLGGTGLEYVPFEDSAGEATEPAVVSVAPPAVAQPAPVSSNSGSSTTSILLPYQATNSNSSPATATTSAAVSSVASNPLTWLLLAPITSTGEEADATSGSSEEHSVALEEILSEV
ncbi:dockerin type I domain-containing protein [Anatilimnocola floriformis]|uniref:dockerin type I domain-containing protein n=1 Tax=Anatilimnocola floriformis TaxID=2948575 RepID=UPI0020C528A5|nr:dockerin type I domain-containing protein [Anatilimnocola floriformis]